MLPNAARYQLRYTPIVIKLWSCKWSNLWSNTFLTAIFCFPNRPKSARLKGFRRFSLSCGANTVYAPKPPALPAAPHPDLFHFLTAVSMGYYNGRCLIVTPFQMPVSPMRCAIHGVTSQNILLVVYAQLLAMSRREIKKYIAAAYPHKQATPDHCRVSPAFRFISAYALFSYRTKPPCLTAPPAPARSE